MLVLVVGPSGAGKDTVLGLARVALADDRRFRFVRRVITRPADPNGEDHEAVSSDDFARRVFALRWHAHGLDYGIPADIEADLAVGVAVVANVSRRVIAEAAARWPVRVIEVTAPQDILSRRLAARGRESPADIIARVARRVDLPVGLAVETVMNDATPEEAAERFVSALLRCV